MSMQKIHKISPELSCRMRSCKNEKSVVSYRHKEGNFQMKMEREANTMVSPNDSEN